MRCRLMSRNVSFLRDLEVEALVPAIIKVVFLLLLETLDLHHLCTEPLPDGLVLLVSPDLGHDVRLRPVLDLQARHKIEQLVRSVKLKV